MHSLAGEAKHPATFSVKEEPSGMTQLFQNWVGKLWVSKPRLIEVVDAPLLVIFLIVNIRVVDLNLRSAHRGILSAKSPRAFRKNYIGSLEKSVGCVLIVCKISAEVRLVDQSQTVCPKNKEKKAAQ